MSHNEGDLAKLSGKQLNKPTTRTVWLSVVQVDQDWQAAFRGHAQHSSYVRFSQNVFFDVGVKLYPRSANGNMWLRWMSLPKERYDVDCRGSSKRL